MGFNIMSKRLSIMLLAFCLSGCASTGKIMQQSKTAFQEGNYAQALERSLPLAEKGNAEAQYAVGYMFYYGKGTAKDADKGQHWIRRAAAQGQPQAIKAMTLLSKSKMAGEDLMKYPESLDVMQ